MTNFVFYYLTGKRDSYTAARMCSGYRMLFTRWKKLPRRSHSCRDSQQNANPHHTKLKGYLQMNLSQLYLYYIIACMLLN